MPRGGNPYTAKAYIRAAESLLTLVTPLGEVIRRSQLRAIPGIGDAIARRIIELRDKGTDEGLERMRGKYPAGLLELLSIPRVKPSPLRSCTISASPVLPKKRTPRGKGRLRDVKGLGASLERNIVARQGDWR